MIDSDTYYTVVFRDLSRQEKQELSYHEKFSAGSYSHAMDDVDELISALIFAEAALADIGDSEHEEDDSADTLEWCEKRAAQALPRIRQLLKAHGRLPQLCTLNPNLL